MGESTKVAKEKKGINAVFERLEIISEISKTNKVLSEQVRYRLTGDGADAPSPTTKAEVDPHAHLEKLDLILGRLNEMVLDTRNNLEAIAKEI